MEDHDGNVRVLVVDDEPSIVDVISMALRHHGYGVEAAASGKEALDRVRRWRPHVMVLDVMLPDMEGFEVARRLSAEHAEVPILFLSARDATADKVRGLSTGGDDYVTKPFSLEEPKITGPGHGFTLVNINDWQAAVASAPLSHLGFHAPLLFTTSSGTLPPELEAYYKSVAPTYTTTPADGPYNMSYVIGSWNQIAWPQQAHVDYISEMGNRRLWNTTTGGGYTDSSPTP